MLSLLGNIIIFNLVLFICPGLEEKHHFMLNKSFFHPVKENLVSVTNASPLCDLI